MDTQVGEAACFFRSDDPKICPGLPPLSEDSTSGPNAPDIELIVVPIAFKNHGYEEISSGDLMTVIAVNLR
jgi:choline dehydrogenase